uniref:tRNA-dihydrouridine(47) synthase [NAD(P)(+)] n=2 Tax=Tetraselmis sp. GSL018 TaxID=582737 RepID=A0A061RNI6_9CHLO
MMEAEQAEVAKGFLEWIFSELDPSFRPHRIDINMGCPSKCTTSRGQVLKGGQHKRSGAGSSLLRSPDYVETVTRAVHEGIGENNCCLSVKMRLGFDNDLLFERNLLAAAQYADFVQIHGRTKADGYSKPARWERIQEAKELLQNSNCRVVGNGDITSGEQARELVDKTGVDGIMIGRAAVSNPFIFKDIRHAYGDGNSEHRSPRDNYLLFIDTYFQNLKRLHPKHKGKPSFERMLRSKLKQIIANGFLTNVEVVPPKLVKSMTDLLTTSEYCSDRIYESIRTAIEECCV